MLKSNKLKPELQIGKFYSDGRQKIRYVGEHRQKDGSVFYEAKLPSPYGGARITGSAKDPFIALENARKKLEKIEKDPGYLRGANDKIRQTYTFIQVYKMLIEDKKDVLTRETVRNRDLHIKKCQKLHEKDISKITQPMLVELLNDLKKPKKGKKTLSDRYVENIMRTIKLVFWYAYDRKIIDDVPFDKDMTKRINWNSDDSRKREALTVDETKAYLAFAKERNLYVYHIVSLLLCTGMRCGEMLALEWSDIDFENGVIHIRKNLAGKHLNELEFRVPKTEAGVRSIPIFKPAMEALQYLKLYQESYNEKNTLEIPDVRTRGKIRKRVPDLVVTTTNCRPNTTDGIRSKIQRMLKAYNRNARQNGLAEMRWFTTHELRNTCITRIWEQCGLSVALKVYVGHRVRDFSLQTYSTQSVNYLRFALKDYDYLQLTEWTQEMYFKKVELDELLKADGEM